MRILIVEDEQALRAVIQKELTKQGYGVDACGDGLDAEEYLYAGEYDCILLDRMLPGRDGVSLLRDMRQRGDFTPVLLLTAKDTVQDRVDGLDAGADDYLVKPFSFDELFARVRALVRRPSGDKNVVLKMGGLELDTVTQKVTRDGETIDLTSREYAMLEYLMRNPGRVLSRERIIEHVWSFSFEGDSNIVDVYIRYLRRKLFHGHGPKLIQTVRGRGYVMREEG